MKQSQFSPDWDQARVDSVLSHYEAQSDDEAVAEALIIIPASGVRSQGFQP